MTTNIVPLIKEIAALKSQVSLLRSALETLSTRANTPAFLATCYNAKRGENNRAALHLAYSALQQTSEK